MILKEIFTVSSQKELKPIDTPLNMSPMIVPKNNVVWFLLEKETVVEQEQENAFKFLMQNSNTRKKFEKKVFCE